MNTDWGKLITALIYVCFGIAAGAHWGWMAFVGFPVGVVIGYVLVSEFRIIRASNTATSGK